MYGQEWYGHQTHQKISRRAHFVINSEDFNLQNIVWCEESLHLSDTGTNNVRNDEFNPRLGYAMVRLENGQNTCTMGVTRERIVWRTGCYKDSTGLSLKFSMVFRLSKELWKLFKECLLFFFKVSRKPWKTENIRAIVHNLVIHVLL